MTEEWRVQAKTADFKEIGEKYNIDQVVARIIRNRDIVSDEEINLYLNGNLNDLNDPHLMKDMDRAAKIVCDAVDNHTKIRIIGDYDVDGINSIYILYSGLMRLGANVDYVVPHRVYDGYGINERLIKQAYDDGCRLLITCDNGIAAYSQIDYAKSLGMTVVVTDHHDVPFEEDRGNRRYIIPPADAVVDPKQEDCMYPWDKICGAVVAWKLIQVVYELVGRDRKEYLDFLEFAAIATVGDVVDLQGENRIIVKYGLAKIKNTSNPGLIALMNLNKLDRANITAYHVGFVIGPCLNASGRLESAMMAVSMLLAKDLQEAERLAGELKALNDERKDITVKGTKKAIEMVENTSLLEDKVLVIFLEDCHESVVGIIAGKVREKFNKPTIVFAEGENCLKGSGRSIECYNMFEQLTACKELMLKFGGHPMAAGMSIAPENLEAFRKKLNEICPLTKEDLVRKIWIDVPMPFDYISESLIEDLKVLEPFGKANEKPVFAEKNLEIASLSYMGKDNCYTRMILKKESGKTIQAVMFSVDERLEHAFENKEKISVIYYPSVNEFHGRKTIQVVISNVK